MQRQFKDSVRSSSVMAAVGDSGGPLIVSDPNDDWHQGQTDTDMLIGIASFGVEECDVHKPVVYTEIRSFAHWIEKVIQDGTVEVEVRLYLTSTIRCAQSKR